MQLADKFHNDPNFDVQVDIKFKNSGSNGGGNMALLNHLANARRLTQTDLKQMIPEKQQKGVSLSNTDAGSKSDKKRPERRLVIDSHRSKIDMRKFQMPKNLY